MSQIHSSNFTNFYTLVNIVKYIDSVGEKVKMTNRRRGREIDKQREIKTNRQRDKIEKEIVEDRCSDR
jgi:hypothetical protein